MGEGEKEVWEKERGRRVRGKEKSPVTGQYSSYWRIHIADGSF